MKRMAQSDLLARLLHARPLVLAAAVFLAGCICAYALNVPPAASAAAFCALLLSACCFRRQSKRLIPILLIAAMLPLGALRFTLSWQKTEPLPDQTGASLSGRICEVPLYKAEDERTICVIEEIIIDGAPVSGRLRVYLRGDEALLMQPKIGDRLECTAHIWRADEATNPGQFNFSNYLRLNGLRGYATAKTESMTLTEAPLRLLDRRKLLREAAGARVDRLFPENAAIARSFLIGDRSRLSDEERENYSKSGAAHLLAISGMHISVLAAAISLVLGRFLSRRASFCITLALLCVYGLLTGYSASLTRAILMYAVYQAAPLLGRCSDPFTRLCSAMLIYLFVRPEAILDTSFVLSYGASAGIMLLTAPIANLLRLNRLHPFRGGRSLKVLLLYKLPHWILASIATTAAAQLAILPAVVHSFGAQPASSFAVNLLAVPLAMGAYILALIGFVSGIPAVALCADHLFGLLGRCVAFFARLPLSSIRVARFPVWLTLLCVAACILASDLSRLRLSIRRFLLLVVIAAMPLSNLCAHLTTLGFSAVFLDAGQADCAVIRSGGAVYLVDTGDDYSPITDYLSAMNYRTKAIFLSHLHADHAGGLADILALSPPETIYLPVDTDKYETAEETLAVLDMARELGVEVVTLDAGVEIALAGDSFADILAPAAGFPANSANDNSMILRVRHADDSLLFCGDASARVAEKVAAKCTVLKVAHHGAKNALDDALLDAADPEAAIFSVGYNTYGHPRHEGLALLDERGIAAYRTDHCGAITCRFSDGALQVETYRASEDENDLE